MELELYSEQTYTNRTLYFKYLSEEKIKVVYAMNGRKIMDKEVCLEEAKQFFTELFLYQFFMCLTSKFSNDEVATGKVTFESILNFKPVSKEYIERSNKVDSIVEETRTLINKAKTNMQFLNLVQDFQKRINWNLLPEYSLFIEIPKQLEFFNS